jgi:hypothetical protein
VDNKFFSSPDPADARRAMAKLNDRKKSGKGFFKIAEGENRIAVLSVRPSAPKGTSYFVFGSQHFFQHQDGSYEIFTCNRETYGKPCPTCDERIRLYKSGDKEGAKKRGMNCSSIGVFQIIDRKAPADQQTVKIYRASYSVYYNIMYFLSSGGTFSNLIYSPSDEGLLGRDLLIIYNKNAPPQMKYTVVPQELRQLGTPEQVALWSSQLVDLTTEAFFPAIDYDEAKIRAFGSISERAELAKIKGEDSDDEDEDEAGVPAPGVPAAQETEKKAEAIPTKAEEKPADTPKPEGKPEENGMSVIEKVKARIAAQKAARGK